MTQQMAYILAIPTFVFLVLVLSGFVWIVAALLEWLEERHGITGSEIVTIGGSIFLALFSFALIFITMTDVLLWIFNDHAKCILCV